MREAFVKPPRTRRVHCIHTIGDRDMHLLTQKRQNHNQSIYIRTLPRQCVVMVVAHCCCAPQNLRVRLFQCLLSTRNVRIRMANLFS